MRTCIILTLAGVLVMALVATSQAAPPNFYQLAVFGDHPIVYYEFNEIAGHDESPRTSARRGRRPTGRTPTSFSGSPPRIRRTKC